MENSIISLIKAKVEILHPPVTQDEIKKAETEVGFSIPAPLKQLYLEVGNGGFGPGYGILGLDGGHTTDEGDSIIKHYQLLCQSDPEDPSWSWPEGLLPFCHWGCAIYSCASSLEPNFPIKWFDPNGHGPSSLPWDSAFISHKPAFRDWLESWLRGADLWGELKVPGT